MCAVRLVALPGRVLIDSADKSFDYLFNKLLVTSNLTRTILNVGASEQLQLDINPTAPGGLDSRYVKRSPSNENQTILPTTDNVPLTLKGFAGGASKLLDIFDSSAPTQFEKWYWDKNANLTMLFGNPVTTGTQSLQTASMLGGVSTILFVNTAGVLVLGGAAGDNGPLGVLGAQQWQFVGQGIIFTNTGAGFGIAVNNLSKANTTPGAGTAWLLRNPTTEQISIGTSGPLVLLGNKIDNSNNTMQFLSLILEQLAADPATHGTGRLYERTDLKQVSWDDGTNFHRLIDASPSGIQQTIQPLTNSIPLTIKSFSGSTLPQLEIQGIGGARALLELVGSEAGGTGFLFGEDAGDVKIEDLFATVLRGLVTRGAPNVAVAQGVTSVAVTFSSSEPDTNYEITVVPAYNTTVWYTVKAVTGFTVNFGTAGPVGGSTFDWHIERIPRT